MANEPAESPEAIALTQSPWKRGRVWRTSSRLIAGFTTLTFALLQFALPAAFADHDEIPSWMRQEQGGWIPAQQAQRLHKADKELLDRLGSLEQARDRYVTSHSSGLQVQFVGQEPVMAKPAVGDLLFAPSLDQYKKIQNGTLLLVDGTLQIIKEGRMVRQVAVDGTETVFRPDGRAEYEIAPDGIRADYAYDQAGPGSVKRTIHLPNGNLTSEYDSQGRLQKESRPDGSALLFKEGFVVLLTADQSHFEYREVGPPLNLQQEIGYAYWKYLGRDASAGEINYWAGTQLGLDEIRKRIEDSEGSRRNGTAGYYKQYLGRTASTGEINWWVANRPTREGIRRGIADSSESKTKAVPALYQEYLGRQPSPADVNWWAAKPTLEEILSGIKNSPESRTRAVGLFFQEFLGRNPSSGDVSWWAGKPTRDEIRDGIKNSTESKRRSVPIFYREILQREASDSEREYWVNAGISLDEIRRQIITSGEGRSKGRLFALDPGAPLAGGVPQEWSYRSGILSAQVKTRPDGTWNQNQWTITPDSIAPTGTLSAPSLTNQRQVLLSFNSSDPAPSDGTTPSGVVKLRASLDDGATWSAPEAVGSSKTVTLSGPDGEYKLRVQFQDAAGNWSAPASRSVTLDTQSPTVTDLAAPALTKASSVTVTWHGNDATSGVASYRWRLRKPDGSLTDWIKQQATSLTLSDRIAAEGSYRLEVQATDQAGNWSSTADRSFTVDRTAPTLAFTSSVLTNQPAYTLTYQAADNRDTTRTFSETLSLIEGLNSFARTVTDTAGNSTTATWTITLDTQPPSATITSGPSLTNASQAAFAWSGTDTGTGVASYRWQLQGPDGSLTDWINQQTTSLTLSDRIVAEGSYLLKVQATDQAGNWSSTADRSFTVDRTPPAVTLLTPASTNQVRWVYDWGWRWDAYLDLQYTVDGSQKTESIKVADDIYSGSLSTPPTAPIERAAPFSKTIKDAADNETQVAWTITVDTKAPAVQPERSYPLTIRLVDKETLLKSYDPQNLTGTYLLKYTVDGNSRQEEISLAQGANPISRTFTDAAGNKTEIAWTITLDTIPPQVTLLTPTLTNQVRWASWGDGYLDFQYTVDGQPKTESIFVWDGWWTETRIFEKTVPIARTFQDAAGNETQVAWTITVDTKAPVVQPERSYPLTIRLVDKETLLKSYDSQNLTGTYLLKYTVDGIAKEEMISLTQGANPITRTFTDPAGNKTKVNWTITLDTIPPQVALLTPTLTNQVRWTSWYDGYLDLQYTVDGQPKTEAVYIGFVPGQQIEKTLTIERTFKDAAGNETQVNWRITVDTNPPAVVLTSPSTLNLANAAQIRAEPDPATGANRFKIAYTMDGVTKEELVPLQEGTNPITRTFTDAAGNKTEIAWTITLDTQPPVVALISSTRAKQVVRVDFYNWDLRRRETRVHLPLTYTVDGQTRQEQFLIATLPGYFNNSDIIQTAALQKKFTDAAGNETSVTWTIQVDTRPVQIRLTSARIVNTPTYRLTYAVDGDPREEDLTLTAEGVNPITREVANSYGDKATAAFEITLDTRPPVLALLSKPLTNQRSYTLRYQADGTGPTRLYYDWVTGKSVYGYEETIQLQEGENETARAVTDAAGNRAEVLWKITLDTVPPLFQLLSPKTTNQQSYPLRYTVDGLLKEETVDLSAWDGIKSLYRTATDAAGNSGSVTFEVQYDTAPPIVDPAPGRPLYEDRTPYWKPLTNQRQYTLIYSVDGQRREETVSLEKEGANEITRTFKDEAGNEITKTWTITRDTTPPAVVLTSPTLTNQARWLTSSDLFLETEVSFTVDGVERKEKFDFLRQPYADWRSHPVEQDFTITKTVSDKAGNSTTATWTIRVDTKPPEAVLTSPAIVNTPTYRLTYTVDGQAKEEDLALIEGNNEIAREFTDLAGNKTARKWTITLDTAPPQVKLISGTVTGVEDYHYRYNLEKERWETGYWLRYSVGGTGPAPLIYEEWIPWEVFIEGRPNRIVRTFSDAAGNQTTVTWTITKDTTAPTAALTSPAKTNRPSYTLTYLVSDNVDAPRTASEPVTLTEGSNWFSRSIRDQAGNEQRTAFTITLDSTPALTLLSAAVTRQASYLLRYDVDGEVKEETVPLKEGANLITRSAAGSTGKKAQAAWTVTLDTKPPEVALLSKAATNQSSTQLRYQVDGQAREEVVSLAQGANRLERRFTDEAGNETAVVWTITLDTAPPVVRILSPALTNSPTYLLRYEVDGQVREETIRLDEGANPIVRQITDEAGNETVASWVITVDSLAPAVLMTSPTLTNQQTYRFGYTVDGESRSEAISLQEGANRITRTFTDPAGNPTTVNWTITLDTQPPVATRTSPSLTNQPFHRLTCTVDGETKEETVSLTEGENKISRTFKDPAGNEAMGVWTITLDTQPPQAALISPTLTNRADYRLLYTVDGESREERLGLSEGANTITRLLRDAAGNSATARWTVTLDSRPPVVLLTSPALTNQPGYRLTYTVDGVATEETIPLQEGANAVARSHRDAAGNETISSWTITLDTVAPTLTLAGPTLTNRANYTLTYRVDSRVVSESVALKEGSNTITRTVADAAGNSTTATWTIILDTLPPVVDLVSSAITNQPGYRLRYKVDGALAEEPITLKEGLNTIERIVRDGAGNNLTARFAITLDTTPPVVALVSSAVTNQPGYSLTYTVDGQARIETVNLNAGVNQIQKTLFDPAGNETTVTWSITLDTTPPAVALTSPAEARSSAYRLTYTVDGTPQEETVTLQVGANNLTRTFRDRAGNETTVTWRINYRGAPAVEITSPAAAADSRYRLTYTVDGQPVSEDWILSPGENRLIVRVTDPISGLDTVKSWKVILSGNSPAFPEPPASAFPASSLPPPASGLLTQTLANGVIATFQQGNLISLELPGQGILRGIQLNAQGGIDRGWLQDSKGILFSIEGGKIRAGRDPDGTLRFFDADGRLMQERFPGGTLTGHAYRVDAQGKITLVSSFASSGEGALSKPDGSLSAWIAQDGSAALWAGGFLTAVLLPGNRRVDYTRQTIPGGGILAHRPAGDAVSWPKTLSTTESGELKEMELEDGTRILMQGGIPTQVRAPDGTLTQYQADRQGELIRGFLSARQGTQRRYDAQGRLTSLTLADGSVLELKGETLAAVRIPEGTLTNLALNSQGHLSSGTLTRPDGTVALIRDGRLADVTLPDGSRISYTQGQPSRLTTAQGLVYTLAHTTAAPPTWVATLDPSVRPELVEGRTDILTQLVYSDSWILQTATRSDGARLEYAQGRLTRLTQEGAATIYTYDSAGRLTRTVTTPANAAQMPITTEYAYDKIRRVLRGSTPIYEYTYEFDPGLSTQGTVPDSSIEITVVRDLESGLVKRYRQGLLISQTDPDGAVTSYEYIDDPTGAQDPYETAVGATQTLPDGTVAHYEWTGSGLSRSLQLAHLTLPDGQRADDFNQPAIPLSDRNGVSSAPGRIGSAARFSRSQSQYLSAPSTPDLTTGDIDYTLAAWVQLASKPAAGLSILSKYFVRSTNQEYGLTWDANYDRFRMYHTGTGIDAQADSTGPIALNRWYFIVAWHDSVKNTLNIQVDNGQVHSVQTTGPAWSSTAEFRIGGVQNETVPASWDGLIDEAGFWKRALSAQERADLFNAGSGNTYSPTAHRFTVDTGRSLRKELVAYYKLDETGGTRADSTDDLKPLIAQAALPTDRASLRSLARGGQLQLQQPDALDQQLQTAVGADQTLPDGTRAHYKPANTPTGRRWTVDRLTLPDGRVISDFAKTGNPLSPSTTTPSVPGKVGNAASLHGNYLSAPDSPDLSMGDIDFSIAAWVQFDSLDHGWVLVNKEGPGHALEYALAYDSGSKHFFLVRNKDNTNVASLASSLKNITTGQWYFVVAWHDALHDTLNLQVNNGPVDSIPYADGVFDGAGDFHIGSNGIGNGWDMNGRIDEVGLWKKVLTPQERSALFNAGAGNSFRSETRRFLTDPSNSLPQRLIAYYNLDEPSGARSDAANFLPFTAGLTLPADQASLRRLVKQGALTLIQPEIASPPSGARNDPRPVLARARVTYQGKPRDTFTYRYEGQSPLATPAGSGAGTVPVLTHITDSAGVTRTYDETKRLTAIEQPDGTRFSVTIAQDLSDEQIAKLKAARPDLSVFTNPQGQEVTIQALSRRLLSDGTDLRYDQGRLEELRLPDGRVLTQFTLDRNGIPLRAALRNPDGSTRAIQNGALVEVSQPEGTKLRYRDNALAEILLPTSSTETVTVSSVGLDASGRLASGEVLLPSGERLTLSQGRFISARLADGTPIQVSASLLGEISTGRVNVSGASADLANGREVTATLSTGQQYRYRYQTDSAGAITGLENLTFRDDFEDGNALGWKIVRGEWQVTGGDFRSVETSFADSGPPRDTIATTGMTWKDYTLTTRFRYETLTHKSNEAHLRFRYQDENNWYSIRTMTNEQGWALWVAGRVGGTAINQRLASIPAIAAGQDHTLSVEVKGSTFRFFLDGTYYGQFSHSALSQGTVGLGVAHGIARFHDIEVTLNPNEPRDPITYQVDDQIRGLRQTVAQAAGAVGRLAGPVPGRFDAAGVNPQTVRILEESADPTIRSAVAAIRAATADPNLALITELDPQGAPLSTVRADGSIALYENGRPVQVLDAEGRLQLTYTYNPQGSLIRTTFLSARRRLAEDIAAARREVDARRSQALRELAQKKGLATTDLDAQVHQAREQLTNQRAAIANQLRALEDTHVKGKQGRRAKSEALDQLRGGINQVEEALRQLESQYAQSLGNLSAQVADLNRQIDQETTRTFTEISTKETDFLKGILRQEIEPILVAAFRRVIGRHPDDAEISKYVDQLYAQAGANPNAALDLAALEQEIQKLPDYPTRAAQVAQIRQQVTDWLNAFVIASPEGARQSLLASLGLSASDAVPLSSADAQRILAWLKSRSLHFGHSAFLALQEYLRGLSPQGTVPDLVTLAKEAILQDILTGVINPKTTGDLEISLATLARIARAKGAAAIPASVSFNDLRGLLQGLSPQGTVPNVIAHVDGNHYLLVTKIDADGTVTLREPNQGPTGATITQSRDEFLKRWQGVVLSPRAPPKAHQILTESEARKITGSFFPLIFLLIASIASAIGTAVTTVVTAALIILAQLAAFMTTLFTTIGGFISSLGGLFQGIAAPFMGLGGIFEGFGAILAGNLLGGLGLIAQGALGMVGLTSFSWGALGQFALTTALKVGLSSGLEALGVNSSIANLTGSFISGGVHGFFNPVGSTVNFFSDVLGNALTSTAVAGTQLGLVQTGLDPALASLAGIGVGTVTNSLVAGVSVPSAYDPVTHQPIANSIIPWHTATGLAGLGYTLSTQLAPTLAGELAFYGIQRLGESVGLDPRLSQLAGIPIQTSLTGALRGSSPSQILSSIGDGLVRGATQVGFDFFGQQAGLDPLVTALSSRALTSAVAAGLNPHTNVFDELGRAFWSSAGRILTADGQYQRTPYERALYLSKVNDFANVVREDGLTAALERHAASILTRDAIESVWKAGGIASILAGNTKFTTLNGVPLKEVKINNNATLYFHPDDDVLLGRQIGNRLEWGTFAIGDDGAFFLRDGSITVDMEVAQVRIRVKDGDMLGASTDIKATDKSLVVKPTDGLPIKYDENGTLQNGIIENTFTGTKVVITDGIVRQLFLPNPDGSGATMDILQRVDLTNVPPDQLFGVVHFALSNGVANLSAEGLPAEYMKNFGDSLAAQPGVNPQEVMAMPLYESGNLVKDVFSWLMDALGTNLITNEVIHKMDTEILARGGVPPQGMTVVTYSGSYQPFLKAIQERGYNISTIVAVGAPTTEHMKIPFGKSPVVPDQVKRVVYVAGDRDTVPLVEHGKPDYRHKDGTPVETIFVQLSNSAINPETNKPTGVNHTQYFAWNDTADPYIITTHRFLARLTQFSQSDSDPLQFLESLPSSAITKDPGGSSFTVDVSRLLAS